MTIVERLARFATRASYDDLSEAAREQLKIRGTADLWGKVITYKG